MNMKTSQERQPYQVQIGLAGEKLDSEIRLAQTIHNNLQSIRGTVGILLALCKGNRKIDPTNLSCVLEMLDWTLDESEDLASGLHKFLEDLTPVPDFEQGYDGQGKAGLRIIPAMST